MSRDVSSEDSVHGFHMSVPAAAAAFASLGCVVEAARFLESLPALVACHTVRLQPRVASVALNPLVVGHYVTYGTEDWSMPKDLFTEKRLSNGMSSFVAETSTRDGNCDKLWEHCSARRCKEGEAARRLHVDIMR